MPSRLEFPRSTPEAQGVASGAILALLHDFAQQELELHSIMLVRHGHVIAEGWWAPYAPERRHMLFSLSKSFTSTAIGLAVTEGRLSVDDFVLSFFPEDAPSAPDANLRAMRVRHLLTMTTGHDQDTTDHVRSQRNWVKAFLSLPVEHAPGTHFCYNTAATYMLSAIVQKVTGETLMHYLRPRLFQPLGIRHPCWETCPLGINAGGYGLSITTEDIARFGQLYLNNGVWNGQRILSEAWIAEATAKQVPNGDDPASDWNQGYGYQFWRCRHNIYRGDGAFGQYCVVMPEQDTVLVITSALGGMQAVLDAVWNHLLPAMVPIPLPGDSTGQAALTQYLGNRRLAPPVTGYTAGLPVAQISGRRILFSPNALKVRWAQLDFTANDVTITARIGQSTHVVPCGLGTWKYGAVAIPIRGKQRVATSGAWTAPATFQSTVRFYESPFYTTIDFRFAEEDIAVAARANVSFSADSIELVGRFE